MATAHPTTRPNVYQLITDRIISQLEQGTAPWHKPWAARGDAALPRNLSTLKPYRGINVWILMSAGYSSPYFLTYKQAQELGGHVKQGEKGLPVVYWKFDEYERENTETGETEKHEYAMCRYYTVFNVAQCEGLRVSPVAPPDTHPDVAPIDLCEQVVAGWSGKPSINHGSTGASYHKLLDAIRMPDRNTFYSAEEYYSTLFHELTHSTGHPSRLDRATLTDSERFGDGNYSREELVAGMGASFIAGMTGIENKTINNSASYIAGWLKALRSDSKLVLVAAGQAQKAADLILGSAVADRKGDGDSVPVVAPPAPVAPAPVVAPEPEQVALTVAKSTCPFVTLRTNHGGMVIDRKRYLAALRGVNVISATCDKPGDIRVLTVVHSRGTMKFFNLLDTAGGKTKQALKDWARKEREKRHKLAKAADWKADSAVRDKWLGKRVTFVPKDEDRHNRITGNVTELLVNPTNGKRGCLITDDHGRQHKTWNGTGALYLPQDAPAMHGEESAQEAA